MNEEIFQAAFVDEFDKIAGLKSMARKGALGLALLGGGAGCAPGTPAKVVAKAPEMPKKEPLFSPREERLFARERAKTKAANRKIVVERRMKDKRRDQEIDTEFQKQLKKAKTKGERIEIMKRRRVSQRKSSVRPLFYEQVEQAGVEK